LFDVPLDPPLFIYFTFSGDQAREDRKESEVFKQVTYEILMALDAFEKRLIESTVSFRLLQILKDNFQSISSIFRTVKGADSETTISALTKLIELKEEFFKANNVLKYFLKLLGTIPTSIGKLYPCSHFQEFERQSHRTLLT